MRIDKFIADNLNVSRKDAKIYPKKNLIKVNDKVITNDSYQINEQTDVVYYQDQQIIYEKYV
jgi:16S rRNA pseudouridine516 synthase